MSHHYTVTIKNNPDVIFGYNERNEVYEFSNCLRDSYLFTEYQGATLEDAKQLVERIYKGIPLDVFVFSRVQRDKFIIVYYIPNQADNNRATSHSKYILQCDDSLAPQDKSYNAKQFLTVTEAHKAARVSNILRDSYSVEPISEEF